MKKSATPVTTFHAAWGERPHSAFSTGVSLHSHTWESHEGLAFLPGAIKKTYILPYLLKKAEEGYQRKWKDTFNYDLGYWTSPISPDMAYDIESKQIERHGLAPIVSITDHDEIKACKEIVSLEWSVPYKETLFHIGVHNLPHDQANAVFDLLRAATAAKDPVKVREAFAHLGTFPDALIVFNHPLVNQGRIGHEIHASLVHEFLDHYRVWIHALEINALQPQDVNRRVTAIAEAAGFPLISGGDRHGFEPNGAINITTAKTFTEFAQEIKEEKKSDILFMPQYRESLAFRYAQSVEAIMAEYPELGARARWHDRVFYQCPDGVTRSFTEMTGERSRMITATNRLVGTLKIVHHLARPIAPIFSRSSGQSGSTSNRP